MHRWGVSLRDARAVLNILHPHHRYNVRWRFTEHDAERLIAYLKAWEGVRDER
jgi:hypothetical protein